ncbi:Uncharacterised protein [Mycobacteroides abscessus subsp. abscessus]|uniref:hypothetical protein n=1 Tax=Mycobacteroides abscessus TaxID=36809 RepID=UPI00092BCDB6|nr:hypothetical protein [Mycobacteroides abscessus]SIB71398.1 Uncharacterised protein [Mycobacteroides abscessus subsp. abscessus]
MTPQEASRQFIVDLNANVDLLEIKANLAIVRDQLPEHERESVLWRYDKCELETYTALSAELKVNPRALNAELKHGCEFHWDSDGPAYSEDEEGEAA